MKLTEALEIVRARLGIAAAAWHVGADKLREHEATGFAKPRYVWVPTSDRFGPPERAGGNPRQLLTRLAGVELHLWAATVDDAEDRITDVIVEWLAVANTSVMFDALNWHTDSVIGRGVPVTLTLRVKLPVTRPARATVKPQTVEHDTSSSAQGDGYLDAGETT